MRRFNIFFSWFERISIIVIVINCISLGLYDPCQNKGGTDCKTAKCHALEILDDVVFAYFAIEMVIKAGFQIDISSLIGPMISPMSFIKKTEKDDRNGSLGKTWLFG